MKKNELPIFNGPSMEEIIFAPSAKIPAWCDIYIDGQLVFENVFPMEVDDKLFIYKSYTETYSSYSPYKLINQVATVKSDNYIIVARKFKV